MSEIGSAAALILAAVLVWAAVAKARAPHITAKTFATLGVRSPRLFARVVPLIELIVAALLCVRPIIGGWAAFALIVAFTAVLLPVVRRGEAVACGCFGSSAQAAVPGSTIVRNAALLAAALSATATRSLVWGWGGIITAGASFVIAALVIALLDVRRSAGSLFARHGFGAISTPGRSQGS